EHGAAAAAEPRGADARADGTQARRGAGGDPFVTIEFGHETDRKQPFKYAAFMNGCFRSVSWPNSIVTNGSPPAPRRACVPSARASAPRGSAAAAAPCS